MDARAIYIRPMRRKWASCSTAGTLSFNDELLGLPGELGDYVIVHELLHFSVPNHGKLWKSLMRAHLGDYERMERDLRRIAGTGEDASRQTDRFEIEQPSRPRPSSTVDSLS